MTKRKIKAKPERTPGDGFAYRNGSLYCEDVALESIAAAVGTPCYVYSKADLTNRARRLLGSLDGCDSHVFFAVKACSNIHVLSLLGKLGCGADIVSGGELFRASVAEIPPDRVVFSGVGKTDREISEALNADILAFNVESIAELLAIERLATESSCVARVAFRVNPNVDAQTHPYISTGLKKNKFGLSADELRELCLLLPKLRAVEAVGLSCHIGSQITTKAPFVKAWSELLKIAARMPFQVSHLDLGGGLGISYGDDKCLSLEDYGRLVVSAMRDAPYRIGLEPGRAIVGPAAVLLSRVVARKSRSSRTFLVVDAGMNDLMRPALYGATHECFAVDSDARDTIEKVDIVGPVCESSDCFQSSARVPELESGALIAFANAGAYGMSMASQYNSRPRGAEVLVDGSTYHVIRKRETYADLVQREL